MESYDETHPRLAALPTLLAFAVNFCRRQFHRLTSQHTKLLQHLEKTGFEDLQALAFCPRPWCISSYSLRVLGFERTSYASAMSWKPWSKARNEDTKPQPVHQICLVCLLAEQPSMFCNAAMLRCVASSFSCSLTLTMQVNNFPRLWTICTLLTTKWMPPY